MLVTLTSISYTLTCLRRYLGHQTTFDLTKKALCQLTTRILTFKNQMVKPKLLFDASASIVSFMKLVSSPYFTNILLRQKRKETVGFLIKIFYN